MTLDERVSWTKSFDKCYCELCIEPTVYAFRLVFATNNSDYDVINLLQIIHIS